MFSHCRLNVLADGFHRATSEVQESIDGMLNELTHLNNQIDNAEPIASTVEKIKDQIQENKVCAYRNPPPLYAPCSILVSVCNVIRSIIARWNLIIGLV